MQKKMLLWPAALALLPTSLVAQANMAPAESPALTETGNCAALGGVAAFDTIVSTARMVEDEDPSYCLVQGVIEPRVGAEGRTFGTGFELRLPAEWNGRFVFQGGGGWDGQVDPATGAIDRTNPEDTALSRGYAVASTDAGHTGESATDGWFGIDMKARADNGFNSVRLVTERTETLMERYYGSDPEYSYFVGCSNGGRQGMVAATRMPDAYDGVVSGAPAFDLTPSIIAWNWNTRALIDAAPDGIAAHAFTDDELQMVSDAAVAQCDAADGSEDGLVFDPIGCTFDPSVLQCEAGGDDNCLRPEQVTALQKIQAGPSEDGQDPLYTGWPLFDVEGRSGMRAWMLGSSDSEQPNARGFSFAHDWMRLVGATPPRPDFNSLEFDITDREFLMEAAPVFAATSTDYGSFSENGGKILWWHGNADPAFSVRHFINWQKQFRDANPNADDFSRVYLAPGMHHCAGGPGLVSFDALSPLVDWVEHGNAPGAIEASSADGATTAPLCVYPAHAVKEGDQYVCSES